MRNTFDLLFVKLKTIKAKLNNQTFVCNLSIQLLGKRV